MDDWGTPGAMQARYSKVAHNMLKSAVCNCDCEKHNNADKSGKDADAHHGERAVCRMQERVAKGVRLDLEVRLTQMRNEN